MLRFPPISALRRCPVGHLAVALAAILLNLLAGTQVLALGSPQGFVQEVCSVHAGGMSPPGAPAPEDTAVHDCCLSCLAGAASMPVGRGHAVPQAPTFPQPLFEARSQRAIGVALRPEPRAPPARA